MPCLAANADGAGAVSESSKIAAGALPPTSIDEASMQATSSLFGAVAKFIKNTDEAADDGLRTNVDAALEQLEARLAQLGTPFLSGTNAPGLADCAVATKLYVLSVAGGHFKSFALPADKYPLVAKYVDASFACVGRHSRSPCRSETRS